MDSTTIFTKTAKGLGETVGKTKALSRGLRKVLKEVDGHAPFWELQERLGGMDGEKLEIALNDLLKDDYIREFRASEAGGAASEEDFDFTSQGMFPETLAQLTIGAYHRALAETPKEEEDGGDKDKASPKHSKDKEGPATVRARWHRDAARYNEETVERAKPVAPPPAEDKKSEQVRLMEEAARQAEKAVQQREAELKAKREADAKAKKESEEKARKAAEEKARIEAAERAIREAEIQAKREAEEKARVEAQAKARHEADERAKKQAEEKARQEAEAKRAAEEKARREAEQAAKKLAEENARREAEAKAKKEAEEKARKEAEDRARREAEEKARREAEERARREAEETARKAAEEKARQEAEDRARRKEEEKVKREAEEKARREAEVRVKEELARARREAEERDKKDAEERAAHEAREKAQRAAEEARRLVAEQAKLEAEKARLEAEETARRAAEFKRAQEAQERAAEEARLRREAELQKQKEMRELEARVAAEKMRLDAEKAAKADAEARERLEAEQRQLRREEEKATREAEALAKKQIKEEARRKAEQEAEQAAQERALKKAQEKEQREREAEARRAEKEQARQEKELERETQRQAIWEEEPETTGGLAMPRISINLGWLKTAAVGVFVVALMGVAAVPFISFNDQAVLFEKTVSAQFHQPVKIGSVYFALLPRPHWRIEDVAIGDHAQIKAKEVALNQPFGEWFNEKPVIESVEISSPVLNDEGMGWLLFGKPQGGSLHLGHVIVSNAKWEPDRVGFFDIDAEAGSDGSWKNMTLSSSGRQVQLELHPDGGAIRMELNAADFHMPFGASFSLAGLHAVGVMRPGHMDVSQFHGIFYEGTIDGAAALDWNAGWSLQGELHAMHMNAAVVAPGIFESGSAQSDAKFSMQSDKSDQLFAAPHAEGSFVVNGGALAGVDLVDLFKGALKGGRSAFSEFTGGFTYADGKTQLRGIRLKGGLLAAAGYADVSPDSNLNGHFVVDLKSEGTRAHGDLAVSGTVKAPRFAR